MPTIAAAQLAAQQIFAACPGLLSDRIEPHALFVGAAADGACGIRIRDHGDGRPSIERAVASLVAGEAGLPSFAIVIDTVPCREIDKLAEIFSDDGSLKSPDRTMRSILLRYREGANIILVDGLNQCWARFATCMELSHILLGHKHDLRTFDIPTQLRQALTIMRDCGANGDLNGEDLAWITAIELMLPAADRANIVQRRQQGEEMMSIALAYHVPKAILDIFFEMEWEPSGR